MGRDADRETAEVRAEQPSRPPLGLAYPRARGLDRVQAAIDADVTGDDRAGQRGRALVTGRAEQTLAGGAAVQGREIAGQQWRVGGQAERITSVDRCMSGWAVHDCGTVAGRTSLRSREGHQRPAPARYGDPNRRARRIHRYQPRKQTNGASLMV